MLGIWCSHAEYQLSLINNILPFYISNKSSLEYYSDALAKLYTVAFLNANPILCYAIGVFPNDVPGAGSHYDFMDRLWLENPEVLQKRQGSLHPFKSKPRKKLGKNQKGCFNKFLPKLLWNHPQKLVSLVT